MFRFAQLGVHTGELTDGEIDQLLICAFGGEQGFAQLAVQKRQALGPPRWELENVAHIYRAWIRLDSRGSGVGERRSMTMTLPILCTSEPRIAH